jgi:hypothetical protein
LDVESISRVIIRRTKFVWRLVLIRAQPVCTVAAVLRIDVRPAVEPLVAFSSWDRNPPK